MRKIYLFLILCACSVGSFAQGTFSGDFQMNLNFFQRDSSIKASGNPLYDNYLNGNEGWLDLRYNNNGFTIFARADIFNNSNLKNPTQANTAFGIGAWSVSKDMKDLSITVGYIYTQIGSGILFRAYEDRGLLIDNALVGIQLKYRLTDNISMKGFTGQQKNNDLGTNPLTVSQRYAPIIKGFNIEGDFSLGKKQTTHLLPGIGILNRTLDQASMDAVVSTINAQDLKTRFEPMYNMYAFSLYNTLTVGDFSWYAEGVYKTHEAILENNALVDKPGNVVFTTLGYARKGLGINFTGKRTQDFVMRTSPNEILLNGMLNWQPIVARIRPQRLMSRYTPASQEISEIAGGVDVLIAPSEYLSFITNYTHINTLDNVELYRELYLEADYQGFDSWVLEAGIQLMHYNQQIYQVRPNVPIIIAATPFAEVTYKFDKKRSLRVEAQYMDTKQDYGSWVFGLVEFNIAPKWSISASDMYNVTPNYALVNKANHYYNIYTSYTKGPHRFSLSYVKQVDGINCTGGVCRYEPAFSGIKANITSSF
ncbi:MAG: hypothetical protein H0X33_12950 [Taibaiella sp.]|nr:hypothetical protein [Taibaiella sp.]